MPPYPDLPDAWHVPSAEFSLAPFWFWNDRLTAKEIRRQLDDFQAHGVDAFVLHPRVGLPEDQGWMSAGLLDAMRCALAEARERGMRVILYDEGMYPSGSACGRVVASDPDFQCRCLALFALDSGEAETAPDGSRKEADGALCLSERAELVGDFRRTSTGERFVVIDRPCDSVIRGLHYRDEATGAEDCPPAADLLNPDAMACFIRESYQAYRDALSPYWTDPICAIFTDEPSLLGRTQEEDVLPGTRGIIAYASAVTGTDFHPHLAGLFFDDEPGAGESHSLYREVLRRRLEETYYGPISAWCREQGIALTGHPHEPDDLRSLRFFDIPGQDVVWRWVEPYTETALSGRQSTQAKVASSAMRLFGKRRNANEFCGAFGHEFTFDEMRWLTHWLLIRGCNLLIPHAFYYSMRGPRRDERPPDVGPHAAWWPDFRPYADACRRLCWLNTDCEEVISVAILSSWDRQPEEAARFCYEHQIDFHYVPREVVADAGSANLLIRPGDSCGDAGIVGTNLTVEIDDYSLTIAGQNYGIVLYQGDLSPDLAERLEPLVTAGRLIRYSDGDAASLAATLRSLVPTPVSLSPAHAALRLRVIRKAAHTFALIHNEGREALSFAVDWPVADRVWQLNPEDGSAAPFRLDELTELAGNGLLLLVSAD